MADDVVPGEVLARGYLGTQLVLWRDPRGDITCQEAYCPHAGASMAVGARLVDGCIECPFHAWRFDAEGWNQRMFFSTAPGMRARLRTYPVRLVAGIVFAWHHPYGDEPAWSLLDVPELTGGGHLPFEIEVRTVEPGPEPAIEIRREPDRIVVTTRTPIDAETWREARHVAVRRPPPAGMMTS
jgi:nitrite reductase/ring-hydroxylating ferredoxin subunit